MHAEDQMVQHISHLRVPARPATMLA